MSHFTGHTSQSSESCLKQVAFTLMTADNAAEVNNKCEKSKLSLVVLSPTCLMDNLQSTYAVL